VYWRRYDAIANRRFETEPNIVLGSLESAMQPDAGAMRLSFQTVLHHVHTNTQQLAETGDVDYQQAENLFREAYVAAPDDPRTFRQMTMLLAERDRWPELRAFALDRIATHRADPWGWMSLGLALRRRGELASAEAVFDSALARLDRTDRVRLNRPELVMTPREAARFVSLTGAERQAAAATFWRFADPLWARDGSDARTEFLARVTYAELRWTVEEFGVHGIDSDRGHIHVRYGPPDMKMQIWPQPGAAAISDLPLRGGSQRITIDELTKFSSFAPADDLDRGFDSGIVVTIWAYENGILFFFRGNPTYAIARIPGEDRSHVDTLIAVQPARWANVAGVSIEEMPTIISRFRHGPDSASVIVGVDAPVSRIREETATNTRVRGDFWLMHRDSPLAFHDTGWLARDTHGWARTVPAGTWAYRAEVTSDAAMIAGRSGDWIVAGPEEDRGFSLRGFGMSDVMLGTSGEPRGVPVRWYDVDIAPGGGTIPLNGDIALLWENYDFGESDGSARYDVTLTLQREYALLVSRVRARVVGGAATLLGIDRVEGRIVIRFERDVAHAPALVDHVILSMDGVPAGDYQLTIQVTDRISGRSASRVTRVSVRG
jgi:GWxTD domain-containing protein